MRILFLGDIVSRLGRRVVKKYLPGISQEHEVDLVFANAENLAGGRGVTRDTVDEMLGAGIDYFTSGNHVFDQPGWEDVLKDDSYRVLRPLNYPREVPGRGFVKLELPRSKIQGPEGLILVSLISHTIDGTASNPFHAMDKFLTTLSELSDWVILVDFHSEHSSIKRALGFYLDGRVSAVLGTHTHVPTADAQVLPGGTAYVSDVGMVGALNSVLGVEKEIIIERCRMPYPVRFEWVKSGALQWNSVLLTLDSKGKILDIKRLDFIDLDTKGNT